MTDNKWLEETELDSQIIKLLPLREHHAQAIVEASSDGNLHQLWFTNVPNQQKVDTYIAEALRTQKAGLSLPFVVIDKTTDKIIGSTRYCNADSKNKRVEIGYTWYSESYQRTSVNTQCKLLLLQHAFEHLNAIAVEFRTNWHNHRSRAAILRLGAKQDGVLRNHQKVNGLYRDTVVFSIIDHEWPSVKLGLEHRLARLGL